MSLSFEWDPRKAAANLRKHGVSFEDAQSVFVAHCYREAGGVVRIISARKATREEQRFYP